MAESGTNAPAPARAAAPAPEIVVLKFGSSVLRAPADVHGVVHAVYAHVRRGVRAVVVVSALGETTDRLLARARELGAADEHAVAALLATGEAQSVALVALAFARAGVPAHASDAALLGLRTRGSPLDAEPMAVDRARVLELLAARPVLVVPGFVGIDESDRTTVLGRGGSDLTAVFLAAVLQARECVLCKDVDGLYDRDPALHRGQARRFAHANHADAARIGGRLLQRKALDVARARGVSLRIAAPAQGASTVVDERPSRLAATARGTLRRGEPRLRVGLLGLGTVGSGVLRRLEALAPQFELVGVAVRRRDALRAVAPAPGLLTNRVDILTARGCDVLVDTTAAFPSAAGRDEADSALVSFLAGALARGTSVVSARKDLLVAHLPELRRAAAAGGSVLRFAAAVGGAVPMLALARRLRALGIERVEAILNTTSQFVLAALAEGASVAEAIARARAAGLAEADVTRDLDGTDAALKLALLADAAFGRLLPPDAVRRPDARAFDPERCVAAAARGRELRFVATLAGPDDAGVALRELATGEALFGTPPDGNRIVVTTRDGREHVCSGAGAGCWPTTEAVVGDLLALWRARARAHLALPRRPARGTVRPRDPRKSDHPEGSTSARLRASERCGAEVQP